MRDALDERRLVFRVLRHWNEMASGQRFPRKDDIDPWLVGDDWSYCLLAKLAPALEHSTFYAAGANLLPPGYFVDGAPLSASPKETLLAAMVEEVPRCIAAAAPLVLAGSTIHLGTRILYRSVLLPLSDDDEHIDGIFGAANFRPMRPGEVA